jgi:LysR family glycine cleavage system transcriptional activator
MTGTATLARIAPAQPPGRRLPPLNALRAFEVTGRHGSFTRAAEELYVTPAAVSQQVRLLEAILGQSLFDRLPKQLQLTAAGSALLPGLLDGFRRIGEAVNAAVASDEEHRLQVSVAPSFGSKWLLPRLGSFQAAHPEIELAIDASMQLVDLTRGEADVAIRYGAGDYPGLLAERLLNEEVVTVCSPAMLEGPDALRTPADLARHMLLHDASPDRDESCPTWEMWLSAAGVRGVDARRGLRFNQASLVLEAAILGRGVALAKAAIARGDLQAGRLVRPFGISVPVGFAYYLVYARSRAGEAKIARFRGWLLQEIKRGQAD